MPISSHPARRPAPGLDPTFAWATGGGVEVVLREGSLHAFRFKLAIKIWVVVCRRAQQAYLRM